MYLIMPGLAQRGFAIPASVVQVEKNIIDHAIILLLALPKRTERTILAKRIVNAFLMWTADHAVCYDHRFGFVLLDKGLYFSVDLPVARYVRTGPSLKDGRLFVTLLLYDAHGNLGRCLVIWAIEGNGGDGKLAGWLSLVS
jgi:hypothetical protein